jgi:HAE1 family hydrophobic/amphiphilic exporter-1
VTFIQMRLAEGDDIVTAAKTASRLRFRAVFLTSLTTIMGLLPLLTERSLQAQLLIPLATSLVFGLITSTILVIIVIPAIYAILGDFEVIQAAVPVSKMTKKKGQSEKTQIDLIP